MPQANLVAAVDADDNILVRAASRHIARYQDVETMLERERPDAVVVATPTSSHFSIVKCLIERGVSVLVEKPIAATVEEACTVVALADRTEIVLAVGHVERFNPAVQELKRRLQADQNGRTFQVKVRREGPFPSRIADIGVTGDLATHDLDIVGHLLQSEPEVMFAQTARRVHAVHEDLLTAVIRYSNGVLATLEVNWLTPSKIRQLSIAGERGLFVVDYLTQDLTWHENGEAAGGWDALDTLRGVTEGRIVRYPIPHREPLAAELAGFLQAVAGHGGDFVSGKEASRALALALSLLESAQSDTLVFRPLTKFETKMREAAGIAAG
jgi:predicted dehydrogenase